MESDRARGASRGGGARTRVFVCRPGTSLGPERRVRGRRPNNKIPVDNWAPVRFLSAAYLYLHKTPTPPPLAEFFLSASLLICWWWLQIALQWRKRRGRATVSASLAFATTLLARLRDGEARFELLEDSAAAAAPSPAPVWPGLSCFARVATSLRGGWSGALNKVEHYGVQRVTGDGRCMFRALVKGMAKNKGIPLTSREEVQDAGFV
uniref:Uncharacterized protein n=1 Tax=Oryza meridionalis TaxID=40149 RepID=A0A0E0CYH4_9ORYZ